MIVEEIKKEIPVLRIHIGGESSELLKRYYSEHNMVIDGKIKNIYSYLRRFRCFVCPLRYGAGMKKKILDAMASGTPVITTSIGAEGIGLRNGKNVLIANKPADFAENVIELYRNKDLWEKISKNGYEVIKKCYNIKTMEEKLLRIAEMW